MSSGMTCGEEKDILQERIDLLESYLCAVAFDQGMELGQDIKIVEDGCDRMGFLNFDFYPSGVALHVLTTLDGMLRGAIDGLDDVYGHLQKRQAKRRQMVKF